jgi:hypothetical protein
MIDGHRPEGNPADAAGDAVMAADFLRRRFGSAPANHFVLIWSKKGETKRSHWLPVSQLPEAEALLAPFCAPDAGNAWSGVALSPKDFGPYKRCEAGAVAGIVGLQADIDLRGQAHQQANLPSTIDEARELARSLGVEPTEEIDSGHGLQVWWLFETPWIFRDATDRQKAAKLARDFHNLLQGKAKEKGWTLDNVSDLSRILRLPGTWNHKTDEPVSVRVLHEGGPRYQPGDFLALIPPSDPSDDPPDGAQGSTFTGRASGGGITVIERASRYVARMTGAVSGQRGHDATFAAAQVIFRGFSLSEAEGRPIMEEFNQRCQPPWSENDLNRKIQEAIEKSRLPEGYLLNQNGSRHAASGSEKKTNKTRKEAFGAECEPDGLATRRLDTVKPQPIRFLVPGIIPKGKLVMLAGDGGHAKSAMTLDLAACLTTGRPCLGLTYDPLPPAEVLLISCEDDLGDTIVPRLLAAQADLTRCHSVEGVRDASGKVAPFSMAHFRAMEQELEKRPGVQLVVIDPAGAFVGRTGVDDHKDSELRALLGPLAEVAARRGVTVLIVKHFNKGATAKAAHKVSGGVGYVNAVRAAFVAVPDPEDQERRLFLPLKYNLGPRPSGLAYRTQALDQNEAESILAPFDHLEPEDRERLAQQLFRIEWLGTVETGADDAVNAFAKREQGPNKVEKATDWLREFLAEFAYPSDEVLSAAQAAGFTFDNVKEAKARLKPEGLHSTCKGLRGAWWNGFGKPDVWTLRPTPRSPSTPHSPQSPQSGKDADATRTYGNGSAPHSGTPQSPHSGTTPDCEQSRESKSGETGERDPPRVGSRTKSHKSLRHNNLSQTGESGESGELRVWAEPGFENFKTPWDE